jgi:hypothetical protein
MNRKPLHTDESWENDAVWKLLDQAPPAAASARFADDTVRAARLAGQPAPWWKRIFSPAPLAGLAAATAAMAIAVLSLQNGAPDSGTRTGLVDSSEFAEIQEIAETETLISAADHLEAFSDMELVSLIGF